MVSASAAGSILLSTYMNLPAYAVPIDRKRNASPLSRLSSGTVDSEPLIENAIHSFISSRGFVQWMHVSRCNGHQLRQFKAGWTRPRLVVLLSFQQADDAFVLLFKCQSRFEMYKERKASWLSLIQCWPRSPCLWASWESIYRPGWNHYYPPYRNNNVGIKIETFPVCLKQIWS